MAFKKYRKFLYSQIDTLPIINSCIIIYYLFFLDLRITPTPIAATTTTTITIGTTGTPELSLSDDEADDELASLLLSAACVGSGVASTASGLS